ncbi:MAG: imidazoleglycerol-phosphate dehydratase HisB [Defluviitaleaceae bacterium]|nr:imidazoleglycerol-phosphate dehydratase HisB [Defluviitaleaceae bacterium]
MRKAVFERGTKESIINIDLNLDAKGNSKISTGIGFFDHMLDLFSFWAGVSLQVDCKGDLHVDGHHSVEDVGICLGQAIKTALGDRVGIARYGSVSMPMDEALVHCTLDISGRGFLVFNAEMPAQLCGTFATELVEEFFLAVAHNAGITLHINLDYGKNTHHIIEGIFKAFGRALGQAISVTGTEVSSTKGLL